MNNIERTMLSSWKQTILKTLLIVTQMGILKPSFEDLHYFNTLIITTLPMVDNHSPMEDVRTVHKIRWSNSIPI